MACFDSKTAPPFQDLSTTVVKKEQEGSKVLRAITQVVSIVGQYATFNPAERVREDTEAQPTRAFYEADRRGCSYYSPHESLR
jgi:hypothetical protein